MMPVANFTRQVLRGLAVLVAIPTIAAAQGTLSGQGFGYPLGGLSTRSLATGGAFGEFDAKSARNPAAVVFGQRAGVFLQYDPEFRQLEQGTQTDRTVTPRFAAIGIFFPIKSRFALGVTSHSLLDRTWGTEIRSMQVFGADSAAYVERFSSEGALNDIRAAGSWALRDNLILGVGIHMFPGEYRLRIERLYDDSLSFAPLRDSSNV